MNETHIAILELVKAAPAGIRGVAIAVAISRSIDSTLKHVRQLRGMGLIRVLQAGNQHLWLTPDKYDHVKLAHHTFMAGKRREDMRVASAKYEATRQRPVVIPSDEDEAPYDHILVCAKSALPVITSAVNSVFALGARA